MKKTLLMLAIILFVLGARAGDLPADDQQVAVKIGYHHFLFPGEDSRPDGDGVLEDGEFDGSIDTSSFNGWTFEAEYDFRFVSLFSLAASVQWYGGTSKWAGYADNAYVRGDMMMSLIGFLVTPKLHLPVGPVDLHTGAGVGVYWLIEDFTFRIEEQDQTYNQTLADSRSRLGYHLQIGFEYHVLDWIGILIEDRFSFVRFYGSDPTTNFDEFDAGGNSFLLGVRFSF